MTIFLQFNDARVTTINIPSVRFTPELRKKAGSSSIFVEDCMKTLRSLFILACVSFIYTVAFAQDSVKVIILSPRIGAKLDRQGRDYFQILMRVNDFESAVFYQSTDKRCYAKISLRPNFGPPKDTIVFYPVGYLINISEKIDHFEDLLEGRYHMGAQPSFAAFQLDTTAARFLVHGALASPLDTSTIRSSIPAGRWRDEELPFAGNAKKYFLDDFPDWGFGFGYSAYFADLSGITSALTRVEDRYRNLGYDIVPNSLNTNVSPLRLLDLKIRFSSSFAALCEAGKTIGSDNVLMEWLSASLLYRLQTFKETRIFPFVGAGVTVVYISAEQYYGDRISPVDTLDQNTTQYNQLASVSVSASEIGMSITAGADVDYQNVFSVTPYVTLSAFPTTKTKLSDGTPVDLHLNSVVLGIRGTIYF